VTRASGAVTEGKGEKARAKGNCNWSALSRGGASEPGAERGALRASGEGRRGKLTNGPPLVSCPVRKVKGLVAVRPAGWAGSRPAGCVTWGEKERGR
jgi:hypothetical protein